MLVLYITFIDFGQALSGSSLRPQKMMQAFLDSGYEVKLLAGSQNNSKREQRKHAIAEINTWLDKNRPDFCYVESPVYPILMQEDISLLKRIHKMRIPMGYFYRDFYWKFPALYPKRKQLISRLKDDYLTFLQRRTDITISKTMDIVYFPSVEASQFFHFKDMRELPPAGDNHTGEWTPEPKTSIYVGGVSGDYGGELLLESFRILNEKKDIYKLILVCREQEWSSFASVWGECPWLEVHHVSGDELVPLYHRASLALLPILRNPYTDISVNVKLFEYLSYGIPIASTSVKAIAGIVSRHSIGLSTDDNPDRYAQLIQQMLDDPKKMALWRENAKKALLDGNLWIHRASQIPHELSLL